MNNKIKIIPIILSGGSGKRLWPVSTKSLPKQFLNIPFGSKYSLFQKTILRVNKNYFEKPIIICSDEHKFVIKSQLEEIKIKPESIIVEPSGRNTAPAICSACLKVFKKKANSMLMVFPSDHLIQDEIFFFTKTYRLIKQGIINSNTLFGLTPSEPKTSYGYIEISSNNSGLPRVESFIEKPSLKKAKFMIKLGNFLWNSGIFLLDIEQTLDLFKKFSRDILSNCEKSLKNAKKDLGFLVLDKESFSKCRNISFDYEILEKCDDLKVLPLKLEWSDLGSWQAIWENSKKNESNNVLKGNFKVKNVNNSLIMSDKDCNIINDVKDLIIVSHNNSLLITSKKKSEEIKLYLEKIKSRDFLYGSVEFRPWGSFKVIEKNEKFIVKRLSIKPRHSISLQKHLHRSEHWTVVEGKATITLNKKTILLKKNQSIYIPKNSIHCIANKSSNNLEIIETKIGEILSEDDIIRYEDPYNR